MIHPITITINGRNTPKGSGMSLDLGLGPGGAVHSAGDSDPGRNDSNKTRSPSRPDSNHGSHETNKHHGSVVANNRQGSSGCWPQNPSPQRTHEPRQARQNNTHHAGAYQAKTAYRGETSETYGGTYGGTRRGLGELGELRESPGSRQSGGTSQFHLPEETFTAIPLAPHCFFVLAPLRHYALDLGDTVGAAWDNHDQLHITEVYCLQPGWYVRGSVQLTAAATVEKRFLERSARRLVIMDDGVFVGKWSPDYSRVQVIDMFAMLYPLVTLTAVLSPAERIRWLHDWLPVPPRLLAERHPGYGHSDYDHVDCGYAGYGHPAVATSVSAAASASCQWSHYQAGRDPEWFSRGLATPEFLRHVQTLVRDNGELLALIETREYDQALRWIQTYDATLARLLGKPAQPGQPGQPVHPTQSAQLTQPSHAGSACPGSTPARSLGSSRGTPSSRVV